MGSKKLERRKTRNVLIVQLRQNLYCIEALSRHERKALEVAEDLTHPIPISMKLAVAVLVRKKSLVVLKLRPKQRRKVA